MIILFHFYRNFYHEFPEHRLPQIQNLSLNTYISFLCNPLPDLVAAATEPPTLTQCNDNIYIFVTIYYYSIYSIIYVQLDLNIITK